MNKVILSGYLYKDPIARTTLKGTEQANICVLVSDGRINADSLINCVAWGQNANLINTTCKEGTNVFLEGRIRISSFTNQETNIKTYYTDIIIDNIEIINDNKLLRREITTPNLNYQTIVNNIATNNVDNIEKDVVGNNEPTNIDWDDLDIFKDEE